MGRLSLLLLSLFGAYSFTSSLASPVDSLEGQFTAENTIDTDVCIIGGGASGTYAAVRLKDKGLNVTVIERNDHLGGHTHTYYLGDGSYIDYGVEGVFGNPLSKGFFNRLGVAFKPLLPGSLKNDYIDFKTGERVPQPANILEEVTATLIYRLAIQKYDYFSDGTFNLPTHVPEELLRPFREFVKKYHLQGTLPLIAPFVDGLGNYLDEPAIYVIQLFGIPHINALLGGYITPKNGMSALYKAAAGVLGADVLYQSTATRVTRSESGVRVIVEDANGKRTLIRARKLLNSAPTTLDNLGVFDLDDDERDIFSRQIWRTYYVAVLTNTGIPTGINIVNTQPENGLGSVPRAPFQWSLQYMGVPNYLITKTIGYSNFTAAEAKSLILSDVKRMDKETYKSAAPQMVTFEAHNPNQPTVSVDDVRGGFYRRLYALQGRKSTYYTGLSFCSDYSSMLWAYTDKIIAEMISS